MARSGSRGETLASVAVLLVLAGIAAGVAWKQGRYDPDVFRQVAPAGAATLSVPGFPVPEGLVAAGPVESFDPATLSDKINGRADLYLAAGFRRLDCRRLAPAAEPDAWIEACAYDMGTFRGAFAVFSRQRRPEAKGGGLAGFSYRTSGSFHAVQGRFYLEATAAKPGASGKHLKGWVEAFVRANPAPAEELGDVALLPVEGRDPDGVVLHAKDAFGFDRLDGVLAAEVRREGGRATAWVSRRDAPATAADLGRAWRDLLVENGGEVREAPPFAPDGSLVEVMGTWELVFARGPVLLGVHEADSRDLALALGREMDAAAGRAP